MRKLAENNDRTWFEANKDRYKAANEQATAFAKTVQAGLAEYDTLVEGKKPIMRIYRDVRFSKDKTPYKKYWGGGCERAGRALRGGYYWHVEPGGVSGMSIDGPAEAFVGGGFWSPEREDLARIREELAVDHDAFRKLLASEPTRTTFGGALHPSDRLKTAPKGYAKDHPAIDLLRNKNFVLIRPFGAAEVAAPNFSEEVVRTFVDMRPFLDYMSAVLGTDSNGVPLY